ncbi:hypothetical protein EW146_g4112 [Bondarzewia mesenterica]|uniref:Uncharacterized protein n=1 Tax=Bondarzewia mesenterica TaxID=1095465 RepID=A0A4S4LVN2_9AGAM|nr:hypothetical protein EW146_g4112 [Bondarzewia mesenterica]
MGAVTDVRSTLGATFIGCIIAVAFGGIVAVQTFVYYRLYPEDQMRIKLMVFLVWLLDAIHTILMSQATWNYLILNFGDVSATDVIPRTLATTVAFTVRSSHIFDTTVTPIDLGFIHFDRGDRPSLHSSCTCKFKSAAAFHSTPDSTISYAPQILLAPGPAPIQFKSFTQFLDDAGISRTGFGSMDHVIDLIMLYTFNNGALTCLTAIVCMICVSIYALLPSHRIQLSPTRPSAHAQFVTMPRNHIWLGLYFAISKPSIHVARSAGAHNTQTAPGTTRFPSSSPVLSPAPAAVAVCAAHSEAIATPTVSDGSPIDDDLVTTKLKTDIGRHLNPHPRTEQVHISVEQTVQYDDDNLDRESAGDGGDGGGRRGDVVVAEGQLSPFERVSRFNSS